MKNLTKNERISVAIYKTEQKDDVYGMYLEGNAKIIQDKDQITEAFNIYYARAGQGKNVQHYINNPSWIFIKVMPENVYYFNTRFFGEERVEVPRNGVGC